MPEGLGLTWADQRLLRVFDVPGAVGVAVLTALVVGALHALAPGHGKSLTAAYLLGTHGRRRDALVLGTSVALMHTLSVAVVAVAWWALLGVGVLDTRPAVAALQAVAGVAAVGIGVVLVRRRRVRRSRHDHDHHGHDRHGHGHHGHGPAGPEAGLDLRGGVLALAAAGGLVPSPSAFLVLVSGLVSGRVALAAALVAAFGVGMAATLTVVGSATLGGRDALERSSRRHPALSRLTARLPDLAGFGVLAGGTWLAVRGIATLAAS